MTKKKKLFTGVLAIGLVAAISASFTLSYLTDKTESRVNNFTYSSNGKSISAMLTEEKWDGVKSYVYDTDGSIKLPIYGWDVETPITTRPAGQIYGIDKAKNLLPNGVAEKNPVITNTGKITDIRTAAKISFVYSSNAQADKVGKLLSDTDLAILLDVLDIDYNTTDWTRKNGETESGLSQVFYYNSILDKASEDAGTGVFGESTTELFTRVKIKADATSTQLDKLIEMGGFAIFIEGFCIQANVVADDASWLTNAETHVKFENSPTADAAGSGYTPA